MSETNRRDLIISKAWVQAVIILFLCGFFALGLLAYWTYTKGPPLPGKAVTGEGKTLFTRSDILGGQEIFLRNGLMEYGSIFGHGAYLGPDFTADYLRCSALVVRDHFGKVPDQSSALTIAEFKTNRYDMTSDTLVFSHEQAQAFSQLQEHYRDLFSEPTTKYGLYPKAITDPEDIRQLTAFFCWSAWVSSAQRPGRDYSYTNNWPPERLVGNHPTASTLVWSVASLIALLGGTGLLLAAFGRWKFLGWHGREHQTLSFRRPGEVAVTPAQRACAGFFFVMAGLFLIQTLVGGASNHYRADLASFFGIDLARILPFNLARTWHVQLSILWVATSFLAAGIFLAPLIAGTQGLPALRTLGTLAMYGGQQWLAYGLLAALVIVVLGSLLGEFAGIHGWLRNYWFGNQGFEYLDLGRFWQILLIIGLFFWVAILFRGLRGKLAAENRGNLPWLFFFSALSIPAFYAVGLLAHPHSHFTVTEFWRFWVVHLWVEDFLELFTTIMVAYIFVLLGVVHERGALTIVYLDILLYSVGGLIGTMHHVYFSGEPVQTMALGAFFSAAEVIPLTLLTAEAWSFLQLGGAEHSKTQAKFPHFWAVMFLAAVGFWNFLGAGVFGFLINLPIVSYYEIGTALTANHAHASMMGVYGMLAVGLALFCLRYLIPEDRWSDRAAKWSFWGLNFGLAWMVFVTLFPLGMMQLYESVNHGYFEARSMEYLGGKTNIFLEWLRLPGDTIFIIGGVFPLLYLCWQGLRRKAQPPLPKEPHELLFTEITGPSDVKK